MSAQTKETTVIISLILIIYGIYEFRRGYSIVTGKGYQPSYMEKIRNRLFGYRNIIKDQNILQSNAALSKTQKFSAYNSLIGGIVFVIFSLIMLVYAIIN